MPTRRPLILSTRITAREMQYVHRAAKRRKMSRSDWLYALVKSTLKEATQQHNGPAEPTQRDARRPADQSTT